MAESTDLHDFAPLDGNIPDRVLDRHPSGRYLALDTMSADIVPPFGLGRAAVWDSTTKTLVWQPADACYVLWIPDGSQVVTLKEYVHVPVRVPPPTQAGYLSTYSFERYSWPDCTLLSACTVNLPNLYTRTMLMSPAGTAVAINSITQGSIAWACVLLRDEGDFQLDEASYENTLVCTMRQQPSFSPGGRYVVSGYHADRIWQRTHDEYGISYHVPLIIDGYEIGRITVVDVPNQAAHEILVDKAIPAHSYTDWPLPRQLPDPTFIDEAHFSVMLPTGETRTFAAMYPQEP